MVECPDRHFEDLSGMVDILIVSDDGLNSLAQAENLMAVPCCQMKLASADFQQMFNHLADISHIKERVNKDEIM